MLLIQRMEEETLSHSEKVAAEYLLGQGSKLKGCSTRQIAAAAYVTPATLVRLGQRMGYEGWKDFFAAFLDEAEYLDRHFQQIDANRPFTAADNQTVIANKIATLYQESIADTLSLLDPVQLQKAVSCLHRSAHVYMVGASISLDCAWLFKRSMQRIGRAVVLEPNYGEQSYSVISANERDCAIVISYSGVTRQVVETAQLLRQNKVPIIAITGLGDNRIRELATYVLDMTTRERLFSKIGNFSTEISVHLLLDVLYSCCFAMEYEKNWASKLENARRIEQFRPSQNQIMRE